tara:strand:- start:1922 stop:2110 length:189 start_codon:yes stop_codon:yes gene_type:complete
MKREEVDKIQIKARQVYTMMKDRDTMDFEPWKQKHIDILIAMDEEDSDFMLSQAYEVYMDLR